MSGMPSPDPAPETAARDAPTPGPGAGSVLVTAVPGIPEVRAGDDLATLVGTALRRQRLDLVDGDILVVSSKIVSKARGLVAPGARRDEVILAESRRVLAERRTPDGLTRIVETLAGPVMAAAGVDASNTGDADQVLLLPHDPDAEAEELRTTLQQVWATRTAGPAPPPVIGVILSDTAGRTWRAGQTDFALGASGLQVMDDLRGGVDGDGRELAVTSRALADEIAAAADLVKGKTGRVPVAHVRGLGQLLSPDPGVSRAGSLVRTGPQDWFGLGGTEAVRAALGVHPGSGAAEAIGIPWATPEALPERFDRALRVALHESPSHPRALWGRDGRSVFLSDPDPFALGQVSARLVVALRGEGLTVAMEREVRGVTLFLDS